MGHLYTTPALRLHTKAHTGYTTRQCIYSPRYIQYALRHVVFCYSFAWIVRFHSILTCFLFSFFFSPPPPFFFEHANLSRIFLFSLSLSLFPSENLILSFLRLELFFKLEKLDIFSHDFLRAFRGETRDENYARIILSFDFFLVRPGKERKFLG